MTKELFTVVVRSPREKLPLRAFSITIHRLTEFLNEIAQQTGSKKLTWAITELRMESPARVGIGLIDPAKNVSIQQLRNMTVKGYATLNKSSRRPKGWSDAALRRGRELCASIDQENIDEITIQNGHDSVELTYSVVSHIDTILPPKPKEAEGSVDGRLDLIDVHTGLEVGIYQTLDGVCIRAVVEDDSPKMRDQIKELLGKHVYALGTIKRKPSGDPKEIVVKEIKEMKVGESETTILDLYGVDPDFTDGLTVEEFLRRQRSE